MFRSTFPCPRECGEGAVHRSRMVRASVGAATTVLWICVIGEKICPTNSSEEEILCYNHYVDLHHMKNLFATVDSAFAMSICIIERIFLLQPLR
jgi:hypothetical protein